jgi:hypothetical protein
MKAVIFRIYTTLEGKKKFLQGKVFKPNGYDYEIFYRDIYPKRSTLWKSRYEKPESESYNIDHLVFEWLLKEGIKEIHYYIIPKRKLLRIKTEKVDRHLKLGNVKQEKLNNHTQLFIPVNLFSKSSRDYSVPWIKSEININDLLKEKEEELFSGPIIPTDVKLQMYQKIKSYKPELAQQLTLI